MLQQNEETLKTFDVQVIRTYQKVQTVQVQADSVEAAQQKVGEKLFELPDSDFKLVDTEYDVLTETDR